MMYKIRKQTATLSTIPNGVKGTKYVMTVMRRLIDQGKKSPYIRLLSADIIKHLPPKKWLAEAREIQKWVRDNIRYTRDINGVETLHSASRVLKLGYGDCDDKTILVGAMLESVGHPVKLKAVGFTPQSLSHVYPLVMINGDWLSVETTENWAIGKEPDNIKNNLLM